MTIYHHPHGELLIGYASGATDEAVSLLVATHLALCPECRRKVSAAEEAGGALLSELAPVPMGNDAFAQVSSRLDRPIEPHFLRERGEARDTSVPEPLRSYLGGGFDSLKWQHIVGGISQYRIFQRGAVSIRLIRAEPGSAVAMHTHRGEELTMVMAGGFTDATGHYNRGDVQTTSPAITHSPATIPGGPCINLAVTDSPLIFQNWPAKIVGKLFRF
jgi:putative transcriptional regulator